MGSVYVRCIQRSLVVWGRHATKRGGRTPGDPLGPFLFSRALQKVTRELQTRLQNGADTTVRPPLLLQLWYLDDGHIVGSHEAIRPALHFLSSAEVRSLRLHLRMDECAVWWPTAPPPSVQQSFPSDLRQDYCEGTEVLRAPIGSDLFMEREFSNHVASLEPLLNSLLTLEDTQVALHLLRTCFGVCRINYLLRVVPPHSTAKGAAEFDTAVEATLRGLMGGVLDTNTFRELQLPVAPFGPFKPTFGIGLRSAKLTAAAAFLSTVSLTRALCSALLPVLPNTALHSYKSAVRAHDDWKTQVAPERVVQFTAFDSTQRFGQGQLARPVEEQAFDAMPKGDERTVAFRASLLVDGCKDWLSW